MKNERTHKLVKAAVAGLLVGTAACGGNNSSAHAPTGPATAGTAQSSQMSCGGHEDGSSCHHSDPEKK